MTTIGIGLEFARAMADAYVVAVMESGIRGYGRANSEHRS